MRPKRGTPDFTLMLVVLVLLALGIVMVFSSSYYAAGEQMGDPLYYFRRQVIWALIGLPAMLVAMNYDYQRLKRWTAPFLLLSLLLLVVVLLAGVSGGGASRWLALGPITLQPSEMIKLAMVLYLARFLSGHQQDLTSFTRGILPVLLTVGVAAGLILAQPDLGTALALAGTTFLMLLAGGARLWHLALLAGAGSAAALGAIFLEPYRFRRLVAFLDPWSPANASAGGWQTIQGLLALGNGLLFGTGLGHGRQKLLYVPELHTDFIFAILGEELGFIGGALVLLLFLLLAWRGLRVAMTAPDTYGSLLAAGLTSMVVLQATINIGVVTGSLPVTGITLPLVSYGGSSLVFTLVGMGILLNISRQCVRD